MAWVIWFIYCFIGIIQPISSHRGLEYCHSGLRFTSATLRYYCPHFVLQKFNSFKWLLIIWAFLTLLAKLFKGYWQKNHGFDATENTLAIR